MRAVVQRVARAAVRIDGLEVCAMAHGLLILLAVEDADTTEDIEWLSGKIVRLRVFDDPAGSMNLCADEAAADLMVVSQFTLFASTRKGNRPSYARAARPEVAVPLYEAFVRRLEMELGRKVGTGQFGADMAVELVNDGPVTLVIDTKLRE